MRLHAHINECTRHRYLCTFPNILSFVNIERKEQIDKRKKTLWQPKMTFCSINFFPEF